LTRPPRRSAPVSGRPGALAWVPTSYFALGLAYVTVGSVTSVLFKNMGVSNQAAALWSSVLGAPYVLKPLWAPLLEIGRGKRFAVVVSQLVFAGALASAALALALCGDRFVAPALALLLVASFAGATQDIGSDGIYVSALAGRDQARFAGVQSMFWDLGPILASGLFVRLSGTFHAATGRWGLSWSAVLLIIAAMMAALAARHARALPLAPRPPEGAPDRSATATFKAAFVTFFRKKGIGRMIAFAFFYRFGLGLLEKMGPLFMIDDRSRGGLGLSNQTLGDINGTVGTAAFILGSLLGGLFVARRGLRKTLLPLCLCLNVSGVTFLLLSRLMIADPVALAAFVAVEKLGWGVGCVGQMIYMMQQIAPGPYRTAHYTFATTLMLLCLLVTGILSGVIQKAAGYRWFFVIAMIAAAPSLLATRYAPFPQDDDGGGAA
jgi:PAT family beta-lactamase induction signal transducer AmpG